MRAELRGAAAWYEERAGLGADLFDKFDQAIDEIIRVPRTWVRWATAPPDMEIRRYFVRPYLYYIPYLVSANGDVFVMAFAHEKQRPGYWLERLPGGKLGKRE